MDMDLTKLQEMVRDKKAWDVTVHEVMKSWIWLSDWTATTANTKCSEGEESAMGMYS